LQRSASWEDVQRALREQSEASFSSVVGGGGNDGRDVRTGFLAELGQRRIGSGAAVGGGAGLLRAELAAFSSPAEVGGRREVASGVNTAAVMAENERPERKVVVPEIVVSSPQGSKEKVGRVEGAGSDVDGRGGG